MSCICVIFIIIIICVDASNTMHYISVDYKYLSLVFLGCQGYFFAFLKLH